MFAMLNPFWYLGQGIPPVPLQWEAEVLGKSELFWSR